jgi:hypothetical protein
MVRVTGWGALALVLAVALASARPPGESEQKKPAADLLGVLARKTDLEQGVTNTALKEVLQHLMDRWDVTILVDQEAYRAEGLQNIDENAINLPKLKNLRVTTVLRLVAKQVNGAFLVRPDYLELTTAKRARSELSNGDIWARAEPAPSDPEAPEAAKPLPPIVQARFEARPLAEALQELADQTGVSILLDAKRAKEKANEPVTAKLVNMPLDTAVRALSDMAELRALAVDSGLYVTTRENAQQLQAEQDKRRQAMMQQPVFVGGGAAGGAVMMPGVVAPAPVQPPAPAKD